MKYKLNLLLYPFGQAFFLVLACYFVKTNILYAGISAGVAAFFMSFSLHISYHHHVHHKSQTQWFDLSLDYVASMLLGLPFHFYKLQHLNHHKYNNEIGDMTSTYEEKDKEVKAKSLLPYILLWFLNTGDFNKYKTQATTDGYFSAQDDKKMKREGLLNLLVISGLFYLDWRYAILFGLMFYLGWSMIALHNYSQHLPTQKHQIAFSYYGKWYNWLFMNNGLHYEHHQYPQLPYWDLKTDKATERTNKWSHIWDGIRYFFTVAKAKK